MSFVQLRSWDASKEDSSSPVRSVQIIALSPPIMLQPAVRDETRFTRARSIQLNRTVETSITPLHLYRKIHLKHETEGG